MASPTPGVALDLVEDVYGDIVRDEERIVCPLRRIDRDDAEQRRGLLLDRDTLLLHVLRQLRERHLNAVVHVDGVDVGIGAKLER